MQSNLEANFLGEIVTSHAVLDDLTVLRNSLFVTGSKSLIALNLFFHCFRHCSVQGIRPELLKTWFLKGGTLL